MSTMQRPPDEVAPGDVADGERGLARTEIYDVLSNQRRTMVLELLAEDDPRELGELAELIAAHETGERPPPRKKRTSVYVTLHQTHLPKLQSLDIVDYDDREKVVSLGERAAVVLDERGEGAGESQPSEQAVGRSGLSLTMVAAGLGLAGGSELGLPLVATVSGSAYAYATLVVLLAVLAVQVGRETDGIDRLTSSLSE